jgi:PPM family protein phosphatase
MTTLAVGSATDVGMVRSSNQDQVLIASPLFAVADGMGGHAAGEVASLTAIEALAVAFAKDRTTEGLQAAIKEANRAVWEKAQRDRGLRGMGTTLVALALVSEGDEEQLAIVHVGDSRVYLMRQGELEQLTTDHRLVQELIDDGQLSEADATIHPQRHVLTRALGVDPEVLADSLQVLPYKGDRFVLCSDGLSGEITDAEMASILRKTAYPQEAAKQLVSAAMSNGGSDNITVVVVDVVDDDDKAAVASAALAADPGLVIPSELEKGTAEPANGRGGGGRGRRKDRPAGGPKPRALTFRVVAFLFLLLALLAGSVAAVAWYARDSYYVSLDRNQLTIFKGRPGGLLWWKPTVADRTGVPQQAVLASRVDDLKRGKEEATLDDAHKYVANLQAEALAHSASTVTTTVTPTTVTTTTIPTAPSSTTSSVPPAGTSVP